MLASGSKEITTRATMNNDSFASNAGRNAGAIHSDPVQSGDGGSSHWLENHTPTLTKQSCTNTKHLLQNRTFTVFILPPQTCTPKKWIPLTILSQTQMDLGSAPFLSQRLHQPGQKIKKFHIKTRPRACFDSLTCCRTQGPRTCGSSTPRIPLLSDQSRCNRTTVVEHA